MKYRKLLHPALHGRSLSAALVALFVVQMIALPAFGQRSSDAPAKSPTDEDRDAAFGREDEPVVLSPFQVNAERDTGYQATSTMAGTRLRSDLKDIPASISVATKDFMQDINATNLSGLLTYTLGTEVSGPGGNFSGVADFGGVYDDLTAQATPNTRVRGLTSADVTRDFFLTDSPMDSYIVDRVEISRGANAMLFGLGSPAGIVNSSLIKANVNRQRTEVAAQYGSYGAQRATLDHNQVLIKGVLALRVAGLFDDARYRQEEAFERRKGAFVTATYSPFRETTIRANFEVGRSDSNRPEMRPPFDQFSLWWKLGKPVYNPVAQTGRLLGTPEAGYPVAFNSAGAIQGGTNIITTGIGGAIRGDIPALVYSDPNNAATGITGTSYDGLKPNGTGFYNVTTGGQGMRQLQTGSTFLRNVLYLNAPGRLAFNSFQITDPGIFDFYHHQLEGPTKYEWSKWENYNVALEQTFLDRQAGFELVFDKQSVEFGHMMPLDYSIYVDINETLPNGEANPNFLRPEVTGNGFTRYNARQREAGRATAFYNLDLKNVGPTWLGRILGTHVFNGNYVTQTASQQVKGGMAVGTGLDYGASEGQTTVAAVSSTGRAFYQAHYVGDSVLNAATPADATVVAINSDQFPSEMLSATLLYNKKPVAGQTAPSPWQAKSFSIVTNPKEDVIGTSRNSYLSRTETKIHSTAFTGQSFWLDRMLVTTVGWRKDKVDTYNAGSAPQDPATGIGIDDWDVYYPKPVSSLSEESFTWGAVLHSPQFINKRLPWGTNFSLIYNDSSNFRVSGQRFDISGNALGPEIGDTKEYGVRLSTFNGKFELKFAHFETVAGMATVSSFIGAINDVADTLGNIISRNAAGRNASNPAGIAAFEQWLKTPFAQNYLNTFHYQLTASATPSATTGSYSGAAWDRRSGEIVGTSALTSKGVELELVFNPTKNWRIAANVGRAQAIFNDVAPEFQAFIDHLNADLLVSPIGAPVQSTVMGALSSTDTDTWAGRHVGRVVNATQPTFLQQGAPTSELREWRFNAVTHYSFREGRLKGWSIGANVRWQDKGAIGFPYITVNGLNVPDVKHPYKAPSFATWGANIGYTRRLTKRIDWTARLYVQNIGVGDELIPIAAQPDGSIARWVIREPQKWTFSNSFTF